MKVTAVHLPSGSYVRIKTDACEMSILMDKPTPAQTLASRMNELRAKKSRIESELHLLEQAANRLTSRQ